MFFVQNALEILTMTFLFNGIHLTDGKCPLKAQLEF